MLTLFLITKPVYCSKIRTLEMGKHSKPEKPIIQSPKQVIDINKVKAAKEAAERAGKHRKN